MQSKTIKSDQTTSFFVLLIAKHFENSFSIISFEIGMGFSLR